MQLIAYRLGGNVVAARSEKGALAVLEQHEPPGRWAVEDVFPLTEDELALRVSADAPETFAEALARCQADSAASGESPQSRLARVREGMGRPQLILWDLPSP
ncbi:hypothetical protein [Pseudomonas nitroreducens]|uniref:Uncharacterized protein n=1 Tax=Pseudomonas nitroreducens TaxID=46680 RepID=A0A6G6IUW6_PSENT|nr:hypothetical protein [Pseudomonas nitroreducens]QIE84976.1 hypothetical protein G5B91_01305 [Pseudomonas nitroreducens]QIE86996.1 hypothetical protein G5B91_12260 [Pseudomonas nitroreducens]